ncbi:hypothetical protein [Thermoanaerobacterium sp. RBIITD]|uniref:hypothetical protein n=1 Tax=Thermoanaerobacterium sp. RBIITD TaxID=1550240 RepID=UPI0012FD8EAD|nr:hypothetical protein [Thermoanaerobacterium sp. RBIITD]
MRIYFGKYRFTAYVSGTEYWHESITIVENLSARRSSHLAVSKRDNCNIKYELYSSRISAGIM